VAASRESGGGVGPRGGVVGVADEIDGEDGGERNGKGGD
jgi:hypothetical protein